MYLVSNYTYTLMTVIQLILFLFITIGCFDSKKKNYNSDDDKKQEGNDLNS